LYFAASARLTFGIFFYVWSMFIILSSI
jgi:hypothetical protein